MKIFDSEVKLRMMKNILINYDDGHNILRLFNRYQILFSPQVKQCAIVSNKHGIEELPNELPNDVRLRILGN